MNAELDTIILITKIQYLYIHACHDMNYPHKLEHAKKIIEEALNDFSIVMPKIDPASEMFPLLVDLKYKMDYTLNTINNTIESTEEHVYYESYDFFTLLHDYFPCLYNCTKNIKEVYYKELIKKLRKKTHELVEENEILKRENENYKNFADNISPGHEKYIPTKNYKYKSC